MQQKAPGATVKILVYGLNFAPEPTGIGKYTGEMAAWLAQQGHHVRVVATPPYYPAWKVSQGYSTAAYTHEYWQGVQVWRCPLWVPKRPGGTRRVLHLLSFALMSLPVLLRQVFWKPDIVWVAAPAFACTPGALLAARLCGAKTWLHVQDFEVDVAFEMGLLRGKSVRALVAATERFFLRRFDVVSSISRHMVDRAIGKGVVRAKTRLFQNWVNVEAVKPMPDTGTYRKIFGIPSNAVVVLFSGTLGAKQGLMIIPELARLLAVTSKNIVFVVCGDGVMKYQLEAAARHLSNLYLLPLQPQERVAELLAMADIQLLPQDAGVADLVLPSKLGSMLASGRPIVATAAPDTEVYDLLQHCGLVVNPGDLTALASAVAALANDPAKRFAMGEQSRLVAETLLAGEVVLPRFIQQMLSLIYPKELQADIEAPKHTQGRV